MKTWSTPVTTQQSDYIPCAVCGGGRFKPCFFCEGFSYVKCLSCGLVQINPQPRKEEVRRRYRESHGEDYLAYELANEAAFLRLQELALEDAGFYSLEGDLLKQKREKAAAPSVLDIGCATGALLAKLRERGWQTYGVEISAPQAEYARRERKLELWTESLEKGNFPEESFDAVLASHLIEHLNRPESLTGEVYRILKKGGRFFITTPNIAGFQARLFREKWRSAIFDHLYLFSAKTLQALLARNGFRVEKLCTWGGLAAGLAPRPLKRFADRAAKHLGLGDVMIVRAVKSG
ncbi:MAG: class I SAM-dependent methyltransferase [Spirochaetaceae bacterium]|jgi:SAM-dependent methyltransferase|nr:class I SAM-dependent methyltransferase [Spirochaetaceae bacterium]